MTLLVQIIYMFKHLLYLFIFYFIENSPISQLSFMKMSSVCFTIISLQLQKPCVSEHSLCHQ